MKGSHDEDTSFPPPGRTHRRPTTTRRMTRVRNWWADLYRKLEREWPPPSPPRRFEDDTPAGRGRTPADRYVDASAVLLACAWGVFIYLSDPVSMFDIVAGAAACVAVWFRRRAPLVTAVLVMPLTAASSMAAVAALIVLFTVAVHRHYLVPLAVGLGYSAAQALYSAFVPGDGRNIPMVVLVHAAVVAFGMFVRARRQLVASLNERVKHAENDAALREERAKQLERQRIAREMHDVLAHRISLLSMHAGALEYRSDAEPQELAQAASVIRGSAHQILRDLRDIIGVLRDGPGDDAPSRPQPTLTDLPALVEESRAADDARIELDNRVADLSAVPMTTGRNAYRMVQEGLTNARKHAPGCLVEMTVSGSPEEGLRIEISNRLPVGRHQRPRIPGGGLGLIGMRERAHLTSGQLEYGQVGNRFQLSAWLPWEG